MRAAAERRREELEQLCSPDLIRADAALANQLRRFHDITYEELGKALKPPRGVGWVRDRLIVKAMPTPLHLEAIFAAIETISGESQL